MSFLREMAGCTFSMNKMEMKNGDMCFQDILTKQCFTLAIFRKGCILLTFADGHNRLCTVRRPAARRAVNRELELG